MNTIKWEGVNDGMEINPITLTVNGKKYTFMTGPDNVEGVIPNSEVLVKTLRNRLNLTGTKDACEEGACGCCTVIMNGEAVTSCMILTVDCDGAEITTIEGLENPKTGELDPLQQAFIDKYAFQCGYCTCLLYTSRVFACSKTQPDISFLISIFKPTDRVYSS